MIKKTTLRFLICLLFFLTGMVHLNAQEIELGEFVKEMNNTLPITTEMCTLTKVTYDAHYVTFHYTLDKMINVDEAGVQQGQDLCLLRCAQFQAHAEHSAQQEYGI